MFVTVFLLLLYILVCFDISLELYIGVLTKISCLTDFGSILAISTAISPPIEWPTNIYGVLTFNLLIVRITALAWSLTV